MSQEIIHISGCRYKGTPQPCGLQACLIPACSGGGCWEGCPHSISGKAWNEGFRAAIKKAAYICDFMVIGGRAWTEEQAIAADALFAAAKNIRTLGAASDPLEELKKENNSR